MSDHAAEPFTTAEARLAARMHRWSDHGVVAIDAADIARRAAGATHAGYTLRARSGARVGSWRMVLALAALLLLGLSLALAAAATLLRTAPIDAYRAVVTRPVDGGVDVVLADADGRERVLRHVTVENLGLDPRYVLAPNGSVSQQGWLELAAYGDGPDRTGLARWGVAVLVDLADPDKAPIVLPAPGFTNGDWGPDGRYALFCTDTAEPPNCGQPFGAEAGQGASESHMAAGAVRVLDPELGIGSEVIVPRVQTFGGGPNILWTADGSGFLAREGSEWGVTPTDGGPFVPGAPQFWSRLWDLSRPGLDDPGGAAQWPWYDGELSTENLASAQLSADGADIWMLLDDTDHPSSRTHLAKLTGPNEVVDSVRAYDLAAGSAWWFTLSPDDTFVALHLRGADQERFVLTPVGTGDATVTAGPVIEGGLAGLVPAVTADAWPGL